MNEKQIYSMRFIARFTVEADTPLCIGSGQSGINIDRLIQTDVNGLPFIPGTSLMGVLRNLIEKKSEEEEKKKWNDLWGYQEGENGKGSRLFLSNAYLIGENGQVIEGISYDLNWTSSFYSRFKKLPIRQHVRISDKGVANSESNGKFDEQILFKGTRFIFELELKGSKDDQDYWKQILRIFKNGIFIGGGIRKGFGKLKIIKTEEGQFDLSGKDFEAYMNYTGALREEWESCESKVNNDFILEDYDHYQLLLTPENFFAFSDGSGNQDIDKLSVKEPIISWDGAKPYFSEEYVLIPATSVKGALAHRIAYHYNKNQELFSDSLENWIEHIGENNKAINLLFGSKKGRMDKTGKRGKVIFSDLYYLSEEYVKILRQLKEAKAKTQTDRNQIVSLENKADTCYKRQFKILDHVSIDRFTGGSIDSALFNEEVVNMKGTKFVMNIFVDKSLNENTDVINAFQAALKDITKGYLALGGSCMRGHGCFMGKLFCNKKEL